MRIVASKDEKGAYSFRLASLSNPDRIIVQMSNGECLWFDNNPGRDVCHKRPVKSKWCWQRDSETETVIVHWWKQDYIHFLDYTSDKREEHLKHTDLDELSPLWKCVKWFQFTKTAEHDLAGKLVVWDFVNQYRIYDSGFTIERDHISDRDEVIAREFKRVRAFNCHVLVRIENALRTKLLAMDGAPPPEPKIPSGPTGVTAKPSEPAKQSDGTTVKPPPLVPTAPVLGE